MTRDLMIEIQDQAERMREAYRAGGDDHRDALVYRLVRDLAKANLDQDEQLRSAEKRIADLEETLARGLAPVENLLHDLDGKVDTLVELSGLRKKVAG